MITKSDDYFFELVLITRNKTTKAEFHCLAG